MNVDKVKLIAHNLKLLAESLEDAIKEDPESYLRSDVDPKTGGEDLIMARDARSKFPFSIECKNVEKLNVYEAYSQAEANSGKHEPILFMKKNRKKPLVVVDAEWFIKHVHYTD